MIELKDLDRENYNSDKNFHAMEAWYKRQLSRHDKHGQHIPGADYADYYLFRITWGLTLDDWREIRKGDYYEILRGMKKHRQRQCFTIYRILKYLGHDVTLSQVNAAIADRHEEFNCLSKYL
jgi:hypothetical protein